MSFGELDYGAVFELEARGAFGHPLSALVLAYYVLNKGKDELSIVGRANEVVVKVDLGLNEIMLMKGVKNGLMGK